MSDDNQRSDATQSNRPTKRPEDPDARRAFELDRLHPALRMDQQYPAVKPAGRWSPAKDDATSPARPAMPETLTDLAPEPVGDTPPRGGIRGLSLIMSLIIIFGVVVLLVLVTQPRF